VSFCLVPLRLISRRQIFCSQMALKDILSEETEASTIKLLTEVIDAKMLLNTFAQV
jgi:hypothetical protein